ncbi:MAG TPA: hypothetical protein VK674_03230 [Candidatus Limnocylindria bacterium]|nr:hypothetical protein [Candidatus Limnocylindria bacterium]
MPADALEPTGPPKDLRDVTQRLTNLSGNLFAGFEDGVLHHHIVSNDRQLPESYAEAVRNMPAPSPGLQAIGLIVGNGMVETADQMLPLPIVMCDRDPVVLSTLQASEVAMIEADSPAEFTDALQQHADSLTPYVPESGPINITTQYGNQKTTWNSKGSTIPRHFLTDQEWYDSAREGMGPRAYRKVDLTDEEQVAELGDDLRGVDGEIVLANFTNMLDHLHGRLEIPATIGRFLRLLPFSPEAVIVSSDNNRAMLTRVDPLRYWGRNAE